LGAEPASRHARRMQLVEQVRLRRFTTHGIIQCPHPGHVMASDLACALVLRREAVGANRDSRAPITTSRVIVSWNHIEIGIGGEASITAGAIRSCAGVSGCCHRPAMRRRETATDLSLTLHECGSNLESPMKSGEGRLGSVLNASEVANEQLRSDP
jgi:hypothetical protein